MDLKKIFGKNLKFYRLSRGYTQEVFAELSNSSISYISNVENGKYGPSFDKIQDFANSLDIDIYLLFCEKVDNLNINNI